VAIRTAHARRPASKSSIASWRTSVTTVAVHVVFEDVGGGDDATEPALWDSCGIDPWVSAVRDVACEARRFVGADVGQTVLYDADGRLRFAGGITGSRGHAATIRAAALLAAISRRARDAGARRLRVRVRGAQAG